MTSTVLDASALLALIQNETSAAVVAAALSGAVVSAVNYSEVLKKTIEWGGSVDEIMSFIRSTPIAIIPFDEVQAALSAELYPKAKPHGMSFADRACLALGVMRKLPVLTAERKMADIDLPIAVKVIRHGN